MWTFEEFMAYQRVSPEHLAAGELAEWREAHEEACERARRTPRFGAMKLPKGADRRYAVAVEDAVGLWLVLWVRRSPKPEYFVMIPRIDARPPTRRRTPKWDKWDPHASWHFDGEFHHKSHGHPMAVQQRQRPDASFTGNANMILTPVTADAHLVGAVCDPSQFDGVLVVAASILGAGRHVVTVDLAQPGHREVPEPGNRLVDQRVFDDCVPQVVVTLWEPTYDLAVP